MNDIDVMDVQEVREERSLTAPEVTNTAAAVNSNIANGHAQLFQDNELQNFRSRWHDVQGNFVDEPRRAVEQADQLVDSVIKRLTEVFDAEHSKMEQEWSKGQDVSTEDLRQALRRYRSFFDRLLSM